MRKTRIDRKGMRFVFVTFALSYVVSILFEGRFGDWLQSSVTCLVGKQKDLNLTGG